ncbi:MAG TPA: archaetidylserine decarboxylase [Alcanivoracaceae bacterium]|nr:archaetidylserine decarboxylase [Alcanivoracaceae bacterium]
MTPTVFDRLFVWSQYLLPHHGISRLMGRFARSETPWIKDPFIKWFQKRFDISLAEAEIESPTDYPTFNAFFTRALKEGARPINPEAKGIVSPADGVISQCGPIREDEILQAKGAYFSVADLLGGDEALAKEFQQGAFATVYLSPKDYHRVHMPVTGTLRSMTYVPGRLFSVNNATAAQVPRLFARNERAVCIFDTEQGPVAVILVGAMIVAAIETVFAGQVTPLSRKVQTVDYQEQPITLEKGAELGRFLLGSTVILLFPEQQATWLPSLQAGTALKVGELMGHHA